MIICPPADSVTGMDGANLAEAVQLIHTDYVTCVTYRVLILYHPLPYFLPGHYCFISPSIPRGSNSNTFLANSQPRFYSFFAYIYGLLLWTKFFRKFLAFIKKIIFQRH